MPSAANNAIAFEETHFKNIVTNDYRDETLIS